VASPPPPREYASRTSLPGNQLAPSAGRRFVRAALAEWTALGVPGAIGISDRLVADAALLVSELVTNAVMHAGTTVDLTCRWEWPSEPCGLVVDVGDRRPTGVLPDHGAASVARRGRGLRLVGALAESWGVTYHRAGKSVWFRLDAAAGHADPLAVRTGDRPLHHELRVADVLTPAPLRRRGPDPEWISRGSLSFLAEASDLLAGQLDEEMIASLATQLLVPRLADWCAVWLTGDDGEARLARVWHADEERLDALRVALEKTSPDPGRGGDLGLLDPGGAPWSWPATGDIHDRGGCALAFPLTVGVHCHGLLVMGRGGQRRLPEEAVRLVEDLSRRVALCVGAARQYSRQAMISRVLQSGLLPTSIADIPGVEAAVVYEPTGEGFHVGGDFYDLFPAGDGRWCFALGDVCGHGPQAAAVIGLARHGVRLLAREGHDVAGVLDRLNRSLVEEGVDFGVGGDGPRFVSLLYGELIPFRRSGAMCILASAGHPLPLLLRADGEVRPVAAPQMLLGITEDATYTAETFELAAGETLLCVTDGVTERRHGDRQFDDDDGLRELLGGCAGLRARDVAERVRAAVHSFDAAPLDDDLALMVLRALPDGRRPPAVVPPRPAPPRPAPPESAPG
jgi:serine phosphatase RsbU (regulator of sigma subunit)/anti-sigma regulatory factor (Ser/Thr protein kinase)